MKKSKRLLALLLALVMVFSLAACGDKKEDPEKPEEEQTEGGGGDDAAEGGETDPDKELEEEKENFEKQTDENTLVVGASDMNGDWLNGFTNNAYDVYVKKLIGNYGAYGTYVADQNGKFVLDPIVNAKEPESKVNEDGSKTYTFFLNDNLVWNDGTPITAKDYVFSLLWEAAPEWHNVGADLSRSSGDGFVGAKEYSEGKSNSIAGIKYIDDTTFELTLEAEKVPYFYETASVSMSPTPMHRFTPDLVIGEDGSSLAVKEGYELSDDIKSQYLDGIKSDVAKFDEDIKAYEAEMAEAEEAEKADYEEAIEEVKANKAAKEEELAKVEKGEFGDVTKTVLSASAYEVRDNYKSNPDVTCGPYNFVSFKDQIAKVELNDKYLGNFEGKKPTIKNVVVQKVNGKLAVDFVLNGNIDIWPQEFKAEDIKKVKEAEDKGEIAYNTYYRNGYGVIPLLTDLGATQHKEVRQAIAWLIDREEFVVNLAGGYGQVINGSYGIAEWTYQEMEDKSETGDVEEDMELTQYNLNFDKANEVLDNSPYVFEKDGTTKWDVEKARAEYDSNRDNFDYWRYNDKGEKLTVNHFATVDNEVSELLQSQIQNNGKQAGLEYTMSYGDFATLLNSYYTPDLNNPKYTAFNMGTGFAVPNDPYYAYHSDFIGGNNRNRVNDKELDKLLVEWRGLDSSEKDKYVDGWVKFQQWYNDFVPEIPLYANEYFDIHTLRVEGLGTTPMWQWCDDIVNITLAN